MSRWPCSKRPDKERFSRKAVPLGTVFCFIGSVRCRKLNSMALTEAQFHRISKVLADPRRFEILTRIADCKEMACNNLKTDLPITPATLSHHVKELSSAGLVEVRREGKFMHMKLRREVWKEYLARLAKI